MAISETVKLLAALALGALLLWGGGRILAWHEGYQENEQRGKTEQATGTIIDEGVLSDIARRRADEGQAQERDSFNRQLSEDNRNEPETGARADRRVPDSRLRAFRERREAREQRARQRLERATGER